MSISRQIAIIVAGMVTSVPATAGPLVLAPTTIQFEPNRRSSVVEVTNPSAEDVDLQFRAFAWSQVDGRELLEPAVDLLVSPAIARVRPHGKQVFRVLDVAPQGTSRERSYRLKLNEIPRAGAQGIAINVEFSLPVFLTPRSASAHITGTIGNGTVELVNRGDRRVRLSALAVRDADGATHDLPAMHSAYLLAGSTLRTTVPAGVRSGAGTMLMGTSDIGTISEPLGILASR